LVGIGYPSASLSTQDVLVRTTKIKQAPRKALEKLSSERLVLLLIIIPTPGSFREDD
jgi:hypothetical protein